MSEVQVTLGGEQLQIIHGDVETAARLFAHSQAVQNLIQHTRLLLAECERLQQENCKLQRMLNVTRE